ncbi:MAG TPA: hypothetical protein DEG17_06640 [Cyanobacteria bacterium UBA11149]|nr:hypothetical protein [Cyanobacteria bacterium UBA11367]HBE59200.1 hypothetical protein [Cyanobacteria bacterium UBA11366]HBK64477.1 hypothetical protein [Cyanobacteria bacterium UBA11166]HBR73561.1 hypothetical protein [Cyanobacteria bacterium UBA11159]HBS69346.1 hypothetical protein [Cyanobacteria bacterium UBA11153]HBW88552.1 hypothetical protein [Cyanobacteria bacterium UBA11149]HCA98267.1 hypothetical protein [Cyanobacteria bacterium UBA9226]
MQIKIKAKLRQYFLNKNHNQGFTITGLLVRVLLYGSVATTLVLPYYTTECSSNCHNLFPGANGLKQSQAKQFIGSINRQQQAYHLEKGTFADFNSFNQLGLGMKPDRAYYRYRILAPMVPVDNLDESVNQTSYFPTSMTAIGQGRKPYIKNNVKNYIGAVFVTKDNTENGTIAAICEMNQKNSLPTTMPKLVNGEIKCPEGSQNLAR